MKSLIIASLIFFFVAVGGVVGYLYFVAEPKRHPDEPAASSEPETSKPVEKDQQVPLPDAAPSKSSPPPQQKQEVPNPPSQTEEEIPEPVPQEDTPIAEPPADVVKPVLIHRVNPEYPEIARKARVEGMVILEAIITKNGDVENVKVLRGVHPVLDQAAMNAVRKWRYKPPTLNGKAVNTQTTITVNFKLK